MEFLSHPAEVVSVIAYSIIPFIFVLTIVVFFHEMGHFLVGRWCGIKVDAFSIGFGKEIFAYTDKLGTRWRFALLPLGGYVKFHGDVNGASMPDRPFLSSMPDAERDVTFAGQKVWKRAVVVAAGPIATFLLAIVIVAGGFYIAGRPVLTPRIEKVGVAGVAEQAGFKPGDLVVSINGRAIDSFEQLQKSVMSSAGVAMDFEVERAGQMVRIAATPSTRELKTPWRTYTVGALGISSSSDPADRRIDHPGLIDSLSLGVTETWSWIERTGNFIAGLFAGRESASQVSGPIGIAAVSGEVAKVGFGALMVLAAILSVSVGLINLVPVPMLDGGHLMYYAIEALRGRPLSDKAQEMGFRVGLALVLMLMVFATSNDLMNLVPKMFIRAG